MSAICPCSDITDHNIEPVVPRTGLPCSFTYVPAANIACSLLCPGSIDPDDKSVRGRAAVLQHSVHVLQRDLQRLRVEQRNQLQLFQHSLKQSSSVILAKLRLHLELEGVAHLVPSQAGFRRKRLEVVPEEEAYLQRSSQLYEEFQ